MTNKFVWQISCYWVVSFILTVAQSAGAVEYTDCFFAEG